MNETIKHRTLSKTDDLDNVYKLFGICAHHCSNIEYGIAFLLQPSRWLKHSKKLDQRKQKIQNRIGDIKEWTAAMKEFDKDLEQVEQDIGELYEQTLGKLIGQLKDKYSLQKDMATYLQEVCDKRNYVIHDLWGTYGRRLQQPEVVKEMLKELINCEIYFRCASNWIWEQAYIANGIINISTPPTSPIASPNPSLL